MSPTPDVGCLICSDPPDSEINHESHLFFGEKTYKTVLTKIFQYLLLPSQDVPMLYWMCRDERFCSRCLDFVEEIEEYQSKIQALELALQHKVEALGKVIASSKKYNDKDYEKRNLRNASEKATEVWMKFRSPVLQSFKIGLLPSATENIAVPSTTSFTVSSSVTPASTSSSRTTRNSLRSSNNNSKKRKEKEPSPCPSFDSTPNVEVSMDGYGNDDNEDDDYSSSQPMGDFVDPESDEDYQPETKRKPAPKSQKGKRRVLITNDELHTSTGRPITAEQAALIRPFSFSEEVETVTPGLVVFPSVRGKYTLIYHNYLYVYRGVEKTCISYRCCQHNYGCKARLRVSYDYATIVDEKDAQPEKHDHEPEPVNCEKKYTMWKMRRDALRSKDSDVNNIVEEKIKSLPPECLDTLPQLESMRRCVRRLKHKIHGKPPQRPPKYKERKPQASKRKPCISALLEQTPPTASSSTATATVTSATSSEVIHPPQQQPPTDNNYMLTSHLHHLQSIPHQYHHNLL